METGNLSITQEEGNILIQLIDTALKNDGLKSAQNALYLTSKIQQAFTEVPEDLEKES
jgi:hypothetical protein